VPRDCIDPFFELYPFSRRPSLAGNASFLPLYLLEELFFRAVHQSTPCAPFSLFSLTRVLLFRFSPINLNHIDSSSPHRAHLRTIDCAYLEVVYIATLTLTVSLLSCAPFRTWSFFLSNQVTMGPILVFTRASSPPCSSKFLGPLRTYSTLGLVALDLRQLFTGKSAGPINPFF